MQKKTAINILFFSSKLAYMFLSLHLILEKIGGTLLSFIWDYELLQTFLEDSLEISNTLILFHLRSFFFFLSFSRVWEQVISEL